MRTSSDVARAVVIGALAGATVSSQSGPAALGSITPETIASPAGANSAQPQLTVSDRGVLLSWIERDGARATLKFAERTSSGWTPARTVASGTDWFVNWADVPSVLRRRDGALAAHWLQKSGQGTYAYDVRLSFSKDDGRVWSPSLVPHHDNTQTEHGFVSLFQMPDAGGGLGLIWLDGRGMASSSPSARGGHVRGNMALRFSSFDRQWQQTPETQIDSRVCECCPTAAAVTSEGPIVAFRNRAVDEARDIFVSRFEKGHWTQPAAAHHDGWQINACPVNGPALSADGRNVVLGWFTGKENQPQAYAAFSADAGRTFGPPIRLDDGVSNGRVDVELLPDGSALALYIEYSDRRPRLNVRRVERSGLRSEPITIGAIEDGRASGYARVARYGNELVFAWVAREDTPRVRTAIARLHASRSPSGSDSPKTRPESTRSGGTALRSRSAW